MSKIYALLLLMGGHTTHVSTITTKEVEACVISNNTKNEKDIVLNLDVECFGEYIDSIFPDEFPDDIKTNLKKKLKLCVKCSDRKNTDDQTTIQPSEEISLSNGSAYYIVYFSHLSKDRKHIDFAYQLKYANAVVSKGATLTFCDGVLTNTTYKNNYANLIESITGSKLLEQEKIKFIEDIRQEYITEKKMLIDGN